MAVDMRSFKGDPGLPRRRGSQRHPARHYLARRALTLLKASGFRRENKYRLGLDKRFDISFRPYFARNTDQGLEMPSPRLLVIEGNSPETMAVHVSFGGTPASKGYSDLLRELLPGASVDICFPADVTTLLPQGDSLQGYDGIAITGSSLHVYNGGDAVTRQVGLVREALT
ncbi:MAG: hypothetical protein Q8K85_14310, partial [Hyphomicrobium sp.]|nr:hypothetical protein [Hyphomicrobium sp.]